MAGVGAPATAQGRCRVRALDADLAILCERFPITIDEKPEFYLGFNLSIDDAVTSITLSSKAYIEQMADKYLPDWRSRPTVSMPATDELRRDYERANSDRADRPVDRELVASPSVIEGGVGLHVPVTRAW